LKVVKIFCQDQHQNQTLGLKTKTKTLFFVLKAPQDQDSQYASSLGNRAQC